MLGLKLPTDPRWVNIVEKNIHEILTDHAFCEQKAASTAISLIIRYPEDSELVEAMIPLAQEELSHFEMVHQKIRERGWVLGRERKDQYVRDLQQFFPIGGSRMDQLVHQLLYAAMIEARSCERFRLLSLELKDSYLKKFYHDFMVSEAGHYRVFMDLAKIYKDKAYVESRWQEYLNHEKEILNNIELRGDRMH